MWPLKIWKKIIRRVLRLVWKVRVMSSSLEVIHKILLRIEGVLVPSNSQYVHGLGPDVKKWVKWVKSISLKSNVTCCIIVLRWDYICNEISHKQYSCVPLVHLNAVHILCGALISTWVLLSQNCRFALTRRDHYSASAASPIWCSARHCALKF